MTRHCWCLHAHEFVLALGSKNETSFFNFIVACSWEEDPFLRFSAYPEGGQLVGSVRVDTHGRHTFVVVCRSGQDICPVGACEGPREDLGAAFQLRHHWRPTDLFGLTFFLSPLFPWEIREIKCHSNKVFPQRLFDFVLSCNHGAPPGRPTLDLNRQMAL